MKTYFSLMLDKEFVGKSVQRIIILFIFLPIPKFSYWISSSIKNLSPCVFPNQFGSHVFLPELIKAWSAATVIQNASCLFQIRFECMKKNRLLFGCLKLPSSLMLCHQDLLPFFCRCSNALTRLSQPV